jgi:hypothetical protein
VNQPPPSPRSPKVQVGCYGYCLEGLDGARPLLVEVPQEWPELRVLRAGTDGRATPALGTVGPETAELPLQSGGWVELARTPPTATFHLEHAPPDRDIVHPYLAIAAAVAARWEGRESFHAGAILVDGGAYAVLGDKESGKSSTLAWFALQGHTVLTDDLLVLDGMDALAGPRCVDLRGNSAERLGVGEALGVVGIRERWRLALEPAPAAAPLRGWVTLAWDEEVSVERARGPERLLSLLGHRSVRIAPSAPEVLMELSSLPVWQLRRPQEWSALEVASRRLLEALAG